MNESIGVPLLNSSESTAQLETMQQDHFEDTPAYVALRDVLETS